MLAAEEKQGHMPGDDETRAREASHAGASVSPFASFKVCKSFARCSENPPNSTLSVSAHHTQSAFLSVDATVCMNQYLYVLILSLPTGIVG